MIKYKITSQDMTTYNECKWKVGEKKVIEKKGNLLCTSDVFHYYDSPELAVILNPIHGDYPTGYRLWKIHCNSVAHDGLKGGSKWQIIKKEVGIPEITVEQKVEFGIRCALEVYTDKKWVAWAEAWLSGEDRSSAAASATSATTAAAYAAAYAAYAASAAYATTAATSASTYAAYAAASAAAYAASAATAAAYAAAYAAYAAADFMKKVQKIIKIVMCD